MRDARWFEDLYRAHHGTVLAYARRRVDDPDDVVAEVFTAAWRARDTLPDPPVGWLIRAASNHVLHAYRSTGRRARLRDRAALADLHEPDHADRVAEATDASSVVLRGLALLGAADRELLRLSSWEQLDHDQLAYVLGCSSSTVRVRLFRARKRLAAAVRSAPTATASPAASPTRLEQSS